MKFTKNRLLSLLLVLAMMLALVPTVFAEGEGSVTIGDVSTLTVGGGKVALPTATCSAGSGEDHDIDFSITEGNAVSIVEESSVKKLSPDHKGTATLTATCKCGATGTKPLTVSAKTILALTDAQKTISAVAPLNCSADVATGKLTAAYNAAIGDKVDKDQLSSPTWTLSPDTQNYGTESSRENGTLTYTATITSKSEDYVLADGQSVTITGTVTFKKAPEVTFGKYYVNETKESRTLNCVQGETTDSKKSITVTLATITEGAKVEYQWYKGTSASAISTPIGSSKATFVDSATSSNNNSTISMTADVTSVGTTYYKLVVTVSKDGIKQDYPSDYFTVTVNNPYRVVLTPSTYSSYVNSYVTYTATVQKFTGTGTDGYTDAASTDYDGITYSASSPDGSVGIGSTGSKTVKYPTTYVNLYGVSASSYSSKVTVTATAWKNNTQIGSGEHKTVTFYPVSTSDVYIAPTTATSATMDESALLSAVQAVRTNAKPVLMKFTSNCGTFNYSTAYTSYASNYSSSSYKVYNTTFTPNTYNYANFSNNPTATFYATDDNGYFVVATGTIRFSAASSITYSTTSSTPVYFKASDFSDYFKTALGGTYNSSYYTLSEVTFGTPRVSNSSVTSGTLYYNNGYVYSTTRVPAANLGYVSYTPSSSAYTYTVSIPFTAYGTYYYGSTATKTVSGTVTIKVNDGHVITMVGTDFKSASIWSDITSKHPGVSYVSFSQPQSTVGKLYYGYTSIASKGSLVSYTDRFNNSNYNYSYANTIKSIDGIYFVPAAGCLDTVTLTYTAYTSATATTGVSDTITFTITKKTASSIFNDVTASNTGKWSADAIDFLARNSIVEGGSYGTFNPNGNMTRGDFVLMLYRMAGKPSVSGISNPFTDVKSTDYYYNAILWAYRNDIVTGVDAKTFAPKKNITREQIAATLYRMAGSPSASGYLTGYYDYAKIHSYATNAMRWAISNGVITGSNGYLTPTNNATRAQVATMLHRYLTK